MPVRQVVIDYDDKISFGKFKGNTVRYIADEEPSYLIWLHENAIIKFPETMIDAVIRDYVADHEYSVGDMPENWGDLD